MYGRCGLVAQWLECRIADPKVARSIRAQPFSFCLLAVCSHPSKGGFQNVPKKDAKERANSQEFPIQMYGPLACFF